MVSMSSVHELPAVKDCRGMGARMAGGKSEPLHLAVGEEGSEGSGTLGGGTSGTGARIARR